MPSASMKVFDDLVFRTMYGLPTCKCGAYASTILIREEHKPPLKAFKIYCKACETIGPEARNTKEAIDGWLALQMIL